MGAGLLAMKNQIMDAGLRAPEGFGARGSETEARLFAAMDAAENEIVIATNVAAERLRDGREFVMKKLRMSEKQVADEGRLLEVMSDYEKTGDMPSFVAKLQDEHRLGGEDARAVAQVFDDLSRFTGEMQKLAKQSGSLPDMDLAKAGVSKFYTHITDNISGRDLSDVLASRGFTESAIDDIIGKMDDLDTFGEDLLKFGTDRVMREMTDGAPPVRRLQAMKRFGGFDMNRIYEGSAWDKFKHVGLPIMADPFDAGLRFAAQAVRRNQLAPIVGKKGELADLYVKAVGMESGTARRDQFAATLYNYLDNKFYDHGWRKAARFITGANVLSKMTFSVMANVSQPFLTNMVQGTKASIKGLAIAMKSANKNELARITAVNHSILADTGRLLGEEGIAILGMEKVARHSLKWTGFNRVERWNRIHAAASGAALIRDTLVKGASGRLRGRVLQNSRRAFQEVGLDLDGILTDVKSMSGGDTARGLGEYLGSDRWLQLEKNALFDLAKQTQFIPTKLTRPRIWNSPLGRIATQFKSFALAQGRLIRDGVFAEFSLGNVAPMARFVAINPMAGEVFADVRALTTGKQRRSDPDDLVARWVDDMLFLGGWGLATDTIEAAQQGDILSSVAGPTADSVKKLLVATANLDADMAARDLFQLPVVRATIRLLHLGANVADAVGDAPRRTIEDYIETLGEVVGDKRSELSLSELVTKDMENKQ
jgi:hypothetical protein